MIKFFKNNRRLQKFRNLTKPFIIYCQNIYATIRGHIVEPIFPDFLIIGAQKSGTTSVYEDLVQYFGVTPTLRKEVHFFDRFYSKGVKWYAGFFKSKPLDTYKKFSTGEASPSYLFDAKTCQRIKNTLGNNVKFVVILRDPVERAISQYFHDCRMGYESRSIEDAFNIDEISMTWLEKVNRGGEFSIYKGLYLERGLYSQQLSHWFQYFPRDNFFIGFMEDLKSDKDFFYSRLCDFLELEISDVKINDEKISNRGLYTKKIPQNLIDECTDFYREDVKFLENLLNITVPWERFNR